MKNYIEVDEWRIVESGFDPTLNRVSESLFSIGNGKMGQRANFEETYSGASLQGSYVGGVFCSDKTRVGWWKIGYPATLDKVVNSTNWIGIRLLVDDVELDLAMGEVLEFERVLHMKEGYLERSFQVKLAGDRVIAVRAVRFCSIVDDEIGAIRYVVKPLNFEGRFRIVSYLDGDIRNEDSNYDLKFWDPVTDAAKEDGIYLQMRTVKTGFDLGVYAHTRILKGCDEVQVAPRITRATKWIGQEFELIVREGEEAVIEKTVAVLSSLNYHRDALQAAGLTKLRAAVDKGFARLKAEQADAWAEKWRYSDVRIEGDAKAQQGIRFNIFQLFQTYTGTDPRLNIGPKGFTGEKYAGATFWDTEAYCVPFYLATAPQEVSRNLLIYRHRQLGKAIENAAMLGFTGGAALYPMVTMDGTESHNEWEITFEEIHRNGAIALAIRNYIRYTGDDAYLAEYGAEVLVAIARFWAQRVNWSEAKQRYVIMGVTGPNEYENNVDNNWYTNTIAAWCLNYAKWALQQVREHHEARYLEIVNAIAFDPEEVFRWDEIATKMYYPKDDRLGVFLQQDGYLDKEQRSVADLNVSERPLNQHWSWDRILRSCFIKQADVLQGFYSFEDRYEDATLRRNFDFYEPRTVHESSLSPCIHSILAAKLKEEQRAYEFYLRTARLDLDDYNNDTEDGLHITSMAGTWMSIVEGFGGMRVKDGRLSFDPFVPSSWLSFSFSIRFRGTRLTCKISKGKMEVINHSTTPIRFYVKGEMCQAEAHATSMLDLF
ncbi:maltose phosphorylase [Parapedobacter pyrenivorans]|uniref:Maltose phosphorylase n=1 Tax=Parapedobacter pyrenivorans TaxID=1305674 RepID=A0A917HYE6_9SPHI|nr:family 65 glycosyl hydrolase domain-containing protein [Parapedobacter pyrenivorans]GGG97354.1 maltose phosphorylase [Parapedobacter pyrenivorans]